MLYDLHKLGVVAMLSAALAFSAGSCALASEPGHGPGSPPGMGPGSNGPGPGGPGPGDPGQGGHGPGAPGSSGHGAGSGDAPGNAGGQRDNATSFTGGKTLFGNHATPASPDRSRTRQLGHNDAFSAVHAGRMISLKDALAAANPGREKVIDVKLFSYGNRAVYRIKLRDQNGAIRTVRINARTGKEDTLFNFR